MNRTLAALLVSLAVIAGCSTGPNTESPAAASPSAATLAPTATLVAETTAAPIPADGIMQPGAYVTHPLPAPDDGLSLTFTVPAGWSGFGDLTIIPTDEPGTNGPGGMAFQFIGVTSLNSDLCHWDGPEGEVDVGTTVDDLVAALVAQTAYEVTDPADVSIAGYSGKRVDVIYPAELFKDETSGEAPGCDEGVTRLFGDGGIYGQGPANRWQTNILDVDGTRFVIVVQDYPGTSAADRAELDAIVDSMVIEP